MNEILELLADRIERGKIHRAFPHPPELAGEDGAAELCQRALAASLTPATILEGGLMVGMRRIGERYEAGTAFIPELILSGKAMAAAMEFLRPHFGSGGTAPRGTVIIGTVAGDVHDIGKNVVRMVLEGDGFQAVDLGVDVTTDKFLAALDEHPGATLAMSALLTTTMPAMGGSIATIRERSPGTRIYIGGAPVTPEFSERVGADGTFPDPHSFVRFLGEGEGGIGRGG
jgi:methanogenic corrinoid protein MtbC1